MSWGTTESQALRDAHSRESRRDGPVHGFHAASGVGLSSGPGRLHRALEFLAVSVVFNRKQPSDDAAARVLEHRMDGLV